MSNERFKRTNDAPSPRPNAPWSPLTVTKPKNIRGQEYLASQGGSYFAGNQSPAPYQSPFQDPNMYEGATNNMPPKHNAPRLNLGSHPERNPHYQQSSFQLSPSPSPNIFMSYQMPGASPTMPMPNQPSLPRDYIPNQPPLPRDYLQNQQNLPREYMQQELAQPRSYVIYDEEEEYGPSTAEIIANQSQDYVDEKLAEYQMTIAQLQEEQERVQKKTFTNWINSHLSKRVPPMRIDDITNDLRDGTKLLALLEVLSGERLPVEKGRVLRRPHFLSNANTALQFLASKRIKLVNINAADLVDGRPPVVLGLIWTIILYFQIEENSRNLEYLNRACSVSSLESVGRQASGDVKAEKWKRSARKTLLNWVSNALPRESGVEVKDFGESWRDGVAFLALIDGIKANLVNLVELKKTNNRHRLNTAFDVAESKLGIAKLLDAEDVDVPKPDEKSIMTYVAQFLHKYPEPKGSTRNYLEMKENIEELLEFLKEKTAEYSAMMMSNSFPLDFALYSIAQLEVDTYLPVYNCFKEMPKSNYQFSEWENIPDLWNLLQQQMKYWLWSIDTNLPGDFQVVGKWLSEAEKLLMDNQIPTAMNEETASYISKKLERHKLFFSDMPRIFSIFANAKATQAHLLTNEHLVSLERRLLDVEKEAKERHILLKYLEHKCCLIAFLNLVESKINGWTDKYDELERVEQQLEQYTNFISRNKIFQEFEKAFVDMQQVVNEYKREGNPSHQEVADINKFLSETEERWKVVSLELKRCQNSLEEVVNCWKTWLHLTPLLKDWLNLAERKMEAPNTERLEFFQDISTMKEKFDTMSNVGKYLIASCKPYLVAQLRQEHDNMLGRFNHIFESTKQYMGAADVIKARASHQKLLDSIFQWIKHAEQIISQNQGLESSEQISFYVRQLEQLAHELEGQENLLKSAERNIDSLLLDHDPKEIENIISPLKQIKESFAKIRVQIANGLKLYNQLLIQQTSLESGQKEIHDWLNEAETLMSTYTFSGGKNNVMEKLNKHKMFFSRTVYYRSVLDTKNNILNQLLDKSVDGNLLKESQKIVVPMQKLNERFERVIETAKRWEKDFVEHINAWDAFKEKERVVIEWLMQSEYYLNEKHVMSKEMIENQKKFFENIDQSSINDLVSLAQNIIKHLPLEEQVPLVQSLENLRTKWLDVLKQAPLHLLKLEFYMEETVYEQLYKEIEKEISLEQQALNHNEDLGSLLRRNEHFCQNEQFIPRLQQVVSNLKRISDIYGQQNKTNDATLKSAYENKKQSMDKLLEKCQDLHKTLQQIPSQWNSYHEKYNEMVNWMNFVDNSIKQIIKDVNNSVEFEKEKAIFQKICQEADIKREDMKWLVKTLDSLLSYATGPQANMEQEKLENLISRYKNLIPSIEITMGKTEIYSRCHTYRREVHEVVCLLEKVRDQTDQLPVPENVEVVKRLIEDQQYAINQLDHQRPHILSMLQRGKDLVKDVNAPEFIATVVKNLETGWNDAYFKTSDKLKELKDVQIIWNNYLKCKNDLLSLLQDAETELRSLTPLQTNPNTINANLNKKHNLISKLQDASEQLMPQLEQFKTELVPMTVAEKGKILEQEVFDIGKMFNNTLESISDRTKYLEDYSDKWNNYKMRLADLQQWAQYVAPKLLEDVSADVLTPQERLNKVHHLKATLIERKKQLDGLSADISQLMPPTVDKSTAKLHEAELAKLQDVMGIMNSTIDLQSKSLSEDVQKWEHFKEDINKLNNSIESLEAKVNKSLPKLSSVNELIALQNELKDAENQSIHQLDTHRDMLNTFDNAISTPQYDHLVSLHPRLLKVHKHVEHTLNKFDNLENNWKVFNQELDDIENWVSNNTTKPSSAGDETKTNKMPKQLEKLEDKINKLKMQNIEINEKQAKLISLGPLLDNISIHISPDINDDYKKRVNTLKNALQNHLEINRDNLNKLSGTLLLSQDVNSKILNINDWETQMRKQMANVERSTPEDLKSCLILVDTLLQDHNDKKPHFKIINDQLNSINLHTTSEEAKAINENFKYVENEYENIAKDLQKKQNALEKWMRLLEWKTDTENHLEYLKTQLEKPLENQDYELNNIKAEILPIQQSINNWQIDTVNNVAEYAPHQVLNSINLPLAPAQIVKDISNELEALKVRIENIHQQREEITKHKTDFKDLEKNLAKNLENQRKQLENVLKKSANLDNVQQIIDDLNAIKNAIAQQGELKELLQSKAHSIMLEDNKSFPEYQNSLSKLNQEDEKLRNEIAQRIETFGLIKQNLNDFKKLVGEIDDELANVNDNYQTLVEQPQGEDEILTSLECGRACLKKMRNCKGLIDELERKGNQLAKLCTEVNDKQPEQIQNDITNIKDKWNQLNDKILGKVHKYENELVIWTQIENAKKELLPRLLDMKKTLIEGAENTYGEFGPAALTKYHNELPSYQALKNIIENKALELQTLNNGIENPNLAALVKYADQELGTIAQNAKLLNDRQALLSNNEQEVRKNIKSVENNLSKIREELAKCDDLSGNMADIAGRIKQCQLLENNLEDCGKQTKVLKSQLDEIQTKFPAFNESIAVKEHANILKKYDNVQLYAKKIKDALEQFIKKFHNDKMNTVKSFIHSQKEKINWCQPESSSDKYNLEVKLAALQEVGASLPEYKKIMDEILHYKKTFDNVPDLKLKAQINHDIELLTPELQELEQNYGTTKALLEENIALWSSYEQDNDGVTNWLRDVETRFKSAANMPLDLNEIKEKIGGFTQLSEEIKLKAPEINRLEKTIHDITEKCPDIHIGQFKSHIQRRYQAIDSEVADHIDKLNALQNAVNVFDESTNMFANWLAQSKVEYQELARMGSPGSSNATAQQLEVIKNYVNNLKHGQILLNSAVDISDTLNANFTLDNRNNKLRIRLNDLREKFDTLRDDACVLMQQIQSVLIAKMSVVESYKQILENLNNTQAAISKPELYPTLAKKKSALQNYKTLQQEVTLHKNALNQLFNKAVELCDDESEGQIKESLDKAEDIMKNISQRIDIVDGQVSAHEAYDQVLDKAKDWLNSMQFEANDILNDNTFDKDSAPEKLIIVQNLLAQKPEGDAIFDACHKLLQKVVEQTEPTGAAEMLKTFEALRGNWNNFIQSCQDTETKLKCFCSKWQDIDELCNQTENWMQDVGGLVKSQYFKDSAQTKRDHLNKLKSVQLDIDQHSAVIKNLLDQAMELEIGLNNNLRISRLVTAQQTLANMCTEAIKKYTHYTDEHESFDRDYDQFKNNLQNDIQCLAENSNIQGDANDLQRQQKKLLEMMEKRSNDSKAFEDLIDRGELLYGHTSAEGRDIIRQKLRDLRTAWDDYTENLNDTANNIDLCLLQLNELASAQDQIHKRFNDLQNALESEKELKPTLHEKRAQLQNHKFIAQEILNQNDYLDNICNRFETIAPEVKETPCVKQLQALRAQIANTMEISDKMSKDLEKAVHEHSVLNEKIMAAKNWLSSEKDKLTACADASGERSDIQQKIIALDNLLKNEVQGNKILADLHGQQEKVKPQTSDLGNEQITKDLKQIEAAFEQHFKDVQQTKDRQADFLKQWENFDEQIEKLTQYCRATDCVFRVNQLKSTLPEKQQQLDMYKQQNADILQKEVEFEELGTRAHYLLTNCNAERQTMLVTQLCHRYQQLKDLSKDVIAQWSNIVAQHQFYADKLNELNICIEDCEKQMQNASDSVLEILTGQKLQANNYFQTLKDASDKILIETAAPGREKIREELTNAQERLDKLDAQIATLHKRQETQNEQFKQYADLREQVLSWLMQMENVLNNETNENWINAQEVRSKLNKYKLLKQDINSYKRVIENLNEKAAFLYENLPADDRTEINAVITDINKRYKGLVEGCESLIKQLDDVYEVYQQYADLQKSQRDYQKSLWDRLTDYSDCSGSNTALQARYNQLLEFQDTLLQSKNQIKALLNYVHANEKLLPNHAKQNMLQELENLNEDLEKFTNTLNVVKTNMEDRLHQWQEYNNMLNKILSYLKADEQHLKLYNVRSFLNEKEEQLCEFKDLNQDICDHEAEFEKMKYDFSELLQMSGETKMLVNVQQITSRFQTIKAAVKDILKKCEEAVRSHQEFNKKYAESTNWLSTAQKIYENALQSYKQNGDINEIKSQIDELSAQQQNQTHLLNGCNDSAERCYLLTSNDGCEVIRLQLQKLQQMYSNLFDNLSILSKNLQDITNKCSHITELADEFENWLSNVQNQLPNEIELKSTLDEKKLQLQTYRDVLNDINNHQSKMNSLIEFDKNLPQNFSMENAHKPIIQNILDDFVAKQNRAKHYVEQYEGFVNDHQQYCQAVIDAQEFIDATHNTISLWGDLNLDQNSLQLNLTRLKNLKAKINDEDSHVDQVRLCGEKVLNGTHESGKVNINHQIDATQQEWEGLRSALDSTIEGIEQKMQQWNDYEKLKQDCFDWIRDCEKKIQIVDLKATLDEKKSQLNEIKAIQGEVLAKELEIDHVVEKGFNLTKGGDYINKYQQLVSKVKDMNNKWQQYVVNHQDFENAVEDCNKWIKEIEEQIDYCTDSPQIMTQNEIDQKYATIQDIMIQKDEGSNKIVGIINKAQIVLANTAPAGHADINNKITDLKDLWSTISLRIADTKAHLDDSKTQWSDFMKQINNINKSNDWLKSAIEELSVNQTTLTEKRAQLDRAIILEEKARIEKIEIDALRAQIKGMLASGQKSQILQANKDLEAYDDCFFKLQKLLVEKQDNYRDHRLYKEAYDDLLSWISRSREKFPILKESDLDDNLSIENAVKSVQNLLNKQAQGELLVEHLVHTGEVVLASTSPQGQEIIRNDIRALRENFEELFRDIHKQKNMFDNILEQWREFKDEYDRFNEWLQQIDILIKNHKLNLMPNLPEKRKQVESMKEVLTRLENGKPTLEKLNDSATNLLQSHLDSFISNKIRQLNSMYQVKLNLAQDALKKVESNFNTHELYASNLQAAQDYIRNANEIFDKCNADVHSKENLQLFLQEIQQLILNREVGQNMVTATLNNGEKVIRTTRSDGRDVVNDEMKQLQSDWERTVKKMSTIKVKLETKLLNWSDYSSSLDQIQKWLMEREAKLAEAAQNSNIEKIPIEQRNLNLVLNERKAALRQINNNVQDVVAFSPMIDSIKSKANDLQQGTKAHEIGTKYDKLSDKATKLYEVENKKINQYQALIDAGQEFAVWLCNAKDRLNKYSEPMGNKQMLADKTHQLKILQDEVKEGQKKLDAVLLQGDLACREADSDTKEIIEKEVALLQEELDTFLEGLNKTKAFMELGIVQWSDYQDQYLEAQEWLEKTEALINSYMKLQETLAQKKTALEEFQVHLQNLFDWQKILDDLNMKAQKLLEACSDARVSNAIMQLTTKYSTLLSMAKEFMRRLEQQYQEHQQYQTIYEECQAWLEKTRDKLAECLNKQPGNIKDVQGKLNTVKSLRQNFESDQNKLRYLLELNERVVLSTEPKGAAKIQERTDTLKQDFEKLLADLNDARQTLSNQLTSMEEIYKSYQFLMDWLDEIEPSVNASNEDFNELLEKRGTLEKFRALQRDISGQNNLVQHIVAHLKQNPDLKEFQTGVDRYENLQSLVTDLIEKLENQVNTHEKYNQAVVDLEKCMNMLRVIIEQHSDCHGDQDEVRDRLYKLNHINSSMKEGERLLALCEEIGPIVISTCGKEGQDTISQEIKHLNNEWASLQTFLQDSIYNLKSCMSSWEVFLKDLHEINQWISQTRKDIDTANKKDKITLNDLENSKLILEKVEEKRDVLDALNDSCEALMERSAASVVRDQTITAQNNYSDLLNIARELVAKMERNQIDLLAYMTYVKDVDSWVEKAKQILDNCTMKGDSNTISQQLNEINALSSRMPEGQQLVNKALDAYSKISVSERDTPKPSATELKKNWDTFGLAVKERQNMLKEKQAQWTDFSAKKKKLELWVKDAEELLKDFPTSNGELSDMKTLHARLNTLQKDIVLKENELKNLFSEAENYQQEVSDLESLQLRLDKLAYNCQTLTDTLQAEISDYNDYYQNLQEAEKWMLQVSFQLMAHNSLFISNKAQAEEQIEQHNKLFDEIQKYQNKLDDLDLKGKQQANRYELVKPRVEEQLNNIHESYQSLLNTSLQIKNRLHDSLAKFQEYDETLDSILNYLNECEPIIEAHTNMPIKNLKIARDQLAKVLELQKSLNAQKDRLADAIVACESATASISRPTSPLESSFQPTPEKEVLVRTKLEDLLDDVNSLSMDLTDKVKEFEQQQRERDELAEWIKSQQVTINDWNIRPSKLRSEAAKHELNAMNDLLNVIGDKRSQGAFDTVDFATDKSDDELVESLNNLENDLMNAIVKKQTAQNIIGEYRTALQDLTDYFDAVIKRVEALEKGSSLNCDKKMLAISEIQDEMNTEEPKKMQDVKDRAAKVNELINNLDKQQIEEQLKSLERRSIEVHKRLERKLHLLGITNNEVEATKKDIADLQAWIKEKSDELKMPVVLFYETKKIDNAHGKVKNVLKALDGKQCFTNNVQKRIQNLQSELEPIEYVQLETALRDIRADQNAFSELLKNELERISKALKAIESFKMDADKAKVWIATKAEEIANLPTKYPLKVGEIEEQILQNRKFEQDFKEFNESCVLNIQRKARNIINDFLEADKAAIEYIVDEINKDYEKLQNENSKRLDTLNNLLNERQAFEESLKEMNDWLDEIETCVNSEVHDSTKTILKEQCTFYEKLLENFNEKEILLNDIVNKANQIETTISSSDALKLKNDLRKMKDRYQNTLQIIKDRLNNLLRQKKKHEEAKKRLEEFLTFLSEMQQRLRDLNKPVGPKIEDVNELLGEYDSILKLLKTNKHNMLDLQGEELPEFQHALEKQDDMIKIIENQLAHLRQLLQLREQFIGLINQIIAFIMQYSDVIIDIENGPDTLEEKIKKYDAIVAKIQEHEGLLASAADKGQKIASEGTAADKNSINEQLQTLKSQLNNLRKAVMTQRQKHQSQLEHHKKYNDELNEILDRLHTKECDVKSRPLIDRDPCTVERELEKHNELSKEIHDILDNFKRIHDTIVVEKHLPDNVMVMLSEGRSLMSSLPAELEDREKYISDNRDARLNYMKLVGKFIDWQDEAESLLNRCTDGIDFARLPQDIDNFKQFFDNDANIRNLVNNEMQQAVNQIWPSLNTCDQMDLSTEYNQTKTKLFDILSLAKSLKTELDTHLENYTRFLQAVEHVMIVLDQNKYSEENINNLPELRSHVQKLTNLINTVESRGNDLSSVNQQAQDLLRHSDVNNRQLIEEKIGALNTKCTNLLSELSAKRNEMEAVAKAWADFETESVVLEKNLESLEDKLKNVDNIVRSRRHLEDVRQVLTEIQNKSKENENAHIALDTLAKQFMHLLEKIHKPSADNLTVSLNKLHQKQKRFNEILGENWKKLNKNLEEIESVFKSISELQNKLNELLDELKTLYVFDEDINNTEILLQNLRSVLKEKQQQSSAIIIDNKDKYLKQYGLVPSDLLAEFTALELLTERVINTMDAKEKEFKRSRTVRTDYLSNVDKIQQWIMQTESQIQNDGLPPTEMRDLLLSKTQEILEIYQVFTYVKQNGQIIMDNTQKQEEKILIQTTIDQISLQLSQIRTWLDDKKQKIENCLDSWTRFLNLYHIVMTWCREKQNFLDRTIELASLQEARHKFSEYDAAVRSIKPIVKHLCDMEKEIGNIAEITGTAELKEKLQEAEDGKVAVEALLLERNSLLQEVCEEWDQCERKMRDISTWIDKTKVYINSKMDKKKPLRDQLSFYEKLLADIQVQKTKLRLSIEKLEVHFRNGLGGDPRLAQHVDEILKVLDDLDVVAKTKTAEVEKIVQQIDAYQMEMHELRQRILQEEQKLRFVMTPSYLAQNREQAIAEQQACESRINSLRSQFKVVSDKTKSLINQGSLDDMN